MVGKIMTTKVADSRVRRRRWCQKPWLCQDRPLQFRRHAICESIVTTGVVQSSDFNLALSLGYRFRFIWQLPSTVEPRAIAGASGSIASVSQARDFSRHIGQ